MARKAACFVECLEVLGLTRLNGRVTTDRVLDMDLKWLKERKVVLIDDTIISGTTIHDGLKTLENAKVKEASVMVFCIDKYWYSDDLIKFNGNSCLQNPYLKLEHAECLKFCSDIVKALSLYPRPYSIDFPIYPNIRISFNQFEDYFSKTQWNIHENTSEQQRQNQIKVFALTPDINTIKKFEEALGFEISKVAHLKIRFYCNQNISKKNEFTAAPNKLRRTSSQRNQRIQVNYLLKIHPLVLFEPLDKNTVEEIFNLVKINTIKSLSYSNSFQSLSSKQRFIQYYFSYQLIAFWKKEFESSQNTNIELSISKRSLDYIFINGNQYDISLSDLSKISLNKIKTPIKERVLIKNEEITNINPIKINAHLTKNFTDLYHYQELPARRLVKKYGIKAFSKKEYTEKLNRLKIGMSFQNLVNDLEGLLPDLASRKKAVSHFLDIAIDNGLVVPITCIQNNYVYRAYRHGENVIWGENNDRLIGYLFKNFKDSINSKELAKVWFEKLFVIFLKVGIQKNILFPYDYDTSPSEDLNIVGVRSYLFGQVAISYTISPNTSPDFLPIIDNDNRGFWTYERLKDDGFIVENSSKFTIDTDSLIDLYSIKNPDKFDDEPSDFTDKSQFIAEDIGDTFGILNAEGILTQRDLVLFTSCLNPSDALNSITAEVNLFHEKWVKNKNYLLENRINKDSADFILISESLRNPEKNISWTAINSGVFKFLGFKNREGFSRIEEITSQIKTSFSKKEANYILRSWLSYWPSNSDWQDERIPIVVNLINELGKWIISTCFYYYAIDLIILIIARIKGDEAQHINAIKTEIDLLITQINDLQSRINNLQKQSKSFQSGQIDFDLEGKLFPMREELKKISDYKARKEASKAQLVHAIENTQIKLKGYAINMNDFYNDECLIEKLEEITLLRTDNSIEELKDSLYKNLEKLDQLKDSSNELLQQYRLAIPRWGKISESLTYKYVLFIKPINTSRIKSIEHHLNITLDQLEKTIYKYDIEKQNTSFRLLPIHLTDQRLVIIVGGYNAGKRLVDIFYHISSTIDKLRNDNDESITCNYYLINKLSKRYEINVRIKTDKLEKDFVDFGDFKSILKHIEKRTSDNGIYLMRDTGSNFKFNTQIIGTKEENCLLLEHSDKSTDLNKSNIHKYIEMESEFTNVDIGIITIVEPEATAIKDVLENNRKVLKKPTNRYYSEGYIGTSNKRYKVAMTKQLNQGQKSVIPAYTALKEQYAPKFLILFGIAGGIHSDLKIGDAVIANSVIGYDKSKDRGKDGLSRRGITYNMEPELLRELGNFEDTYGENPSFQSHVNKEIFNIYIGPIGSGSSVIGSELSKIREWLKDFDDKTLAVETEAEGFCSFNYEEKLDRNESKHMLIVRGISDTADNDKNTDEKTRRKLAAQNAAQCLIKFLESVNDITDI